MILAGGGCLPKLIGVIVGMAAAGLAMACGLKDARAGGAACIAWGATVMLLSRKYPQYRNDRLNAWCFLIAGVGIATFIWPNYFNEKSRVREHVSTIDSRLREKPAGGTHPIAEAKASAYPIWVLDFERAMQQKGDVNVYLEIDHHNPGDVKKASVYVQTESLRFYGPDKKTAIATQLIKLLQADFPQAACNAAARGPFQWGVKASAAPGQAPAILLDSDKPTF